MLLVLHRAQMLRFRPQRLRGADHGLGRGEFHSGASHELCFQLKKPLDTHDERNYRYLKPMKSGETPVFYRDHVVDKLARVCMKDGKKELSRRNVYNALEVVKRRQYRRFLNRKEGEEVELDPYVIAHKAILNCRPLMKLLPFTRGNRRRLLSIVLGGITYQVPFPIKEDEAEFRAMKSMREICRDRAKHGATHFAEIMATELLSAYNNEGATIQAKQDLHKLCEANRAFAHYASR